MKQQIGYFQDPFSKGKGGKPLGIFQNPFEKGGNNKRTLGERDKKILYRTAEKKCENCGKKIDYDEMQAGHKNKAASKGGNATLSNSVCLCWRCNNQQGTDSWAVFRRKQGKPVTRTATSGKKRNPSKKKPTRKNKPPRDPWGLNIKLPKFKLI